MIDFDYYQAPSDEIFNDIKARAIALWQTYDDTYGYASEKVKRIEHITNVKDNAWYMVAMFDQQNQAILYSRLQPESQKLFSTMKLWELSQV
jgi:hypothetical protein